MPKLMFFRQKRDDGGIRTGLDIDGLTSFESFQPGERFDDPGLSWYVDIICEGESLPSDGSEAKSWFLEKADSVKAAITKVSESLEIGIDKAEPFPYRKNMPDILDEGELSIAVSAKRSITGRDIVTILEDVRDNLSQYFNCLEPLSPTH